MRGQGRSRKICPAAPQAAAEGSPPPCDTATAATPGAGGRLKGNASAVRLLPARGFPAVLGRPPVGSAAALGNVHGVGKTPALYAAAAPAVVGCRLDHRFRFIAHDQDAVTD
jgi:hypothetical protein